MSGDLSQNTSMLLRMGIDRANGDMHLDANDRIRWPYWDNLLLYEAIVADGGIIPTSVGVNPVATISALSEMIAEGITGIVPDADL